MRTPGPMVLETATVLVHEGREVGLERLEPERDLADGGLDVAGLVDAELDLAGLRLLDRARHVERDGAGLGVRHEAAGSEDSAQLTDLTHLVGGGDHDVEVGPAFLDLGDVLGADEIGAGRLGLLGLVTDGDDEDADRRAGARGEDDGAADDLVRMAGIDAEADRHLHGLVELGEGRVLDELEGGLGRDLRVRGDLGGRGPVLLAVGLHPFTSTPIERAAPAIIAMADSSESQLRSGILSSAIFRTCAFEIEPTLLRFG
jgi:hypothetical protein